VKIKFRAWDNVAEEMHYCGENIDVIFALGSEGIECTDIRGVAPSGDGVSSMDHLKYMQYTGLKDKNGKDIYEGDILTDHGDEGPLYIEYSEERASFDFVDNFDQFGIVRYATFQISYEQFEVIGNVYENPELLEGESHV